MKPEHAQVLKRALESHQAKPINEHIHANVEIKFDREEYRRAVSEERRKHTKRIRSVLP